MTEELYFYKLVESTYDYSNDNNYVGIWDFYAEYNVGNIVFLNDIYYKCLYGTIGDLPSSHPLLWEVLVPYSVLVKTDYTLIDIDKVDIVRTYTSPYFSDIEKLKNNGTYTIKLPQTINNKAFFENCHRPDTVSNIPYDYIYADYFYNGLTVFLNAEVKVLDTVLFYEVQCVYGVNRLKYLPLFERKLNEILPNEVDILSTDWVVNWNKIDMYTSGKKYKYIDFVSGERTSDRETIDGVIQPVLEVPEPYFDSKKEMTLHPFISSENIIDLIVADTSISDFDTSDLLSRIENKGIILNTLNGNTIISFSEVLTLTNMRWEHKYIPIGSKLDEKGIIITNGAGGGGTPLIYKYSFFLNNMLGYISEPLKLTVVVNGTFSKESGGLCVVTYKLIDSLGSYEVVSTLPIGGYTEINISGWYYYVYSNIDITFNIESDYLYRIEFVTIPTTSIIDIFADSTITFNSVAINSYFGGITNTHVSGGTYTAIGYYDCLANLPKITHAEFLQQMLIHTCGFLGYTSSGELKTYFFDEFVDNLHNGTVYDWSTRYSGLRKSSFQFNDHAQKNYIKFANDKDLTNRNEYVTVNDKTIASEKDLYTLKLDSPLGGEGEKSDYILYEQTVKRSGTNGVSFENKYVGDKWQAAFVIDDNGTAKNINVIDGNYATYQKLIERPIVYECDINLSVYESSNIDFAKPIYIDVLGKYCLLLELQAPNNELCAAKLLLINQTL